MTFEVVDREIRRLGSASGLAEASATLPRGAYTTLRTYGGDRAVRLRDHLARLHLSEGAAGAGRPSEEEVRRAVASALRARAHAESRVRITWAAPRLFVTVEPFEPLPESTYTEGVWCVTVPVVRTNPQAKDTGFLPAARAAYAGLPPGAHEGILVGEDGAILEGLSSNFFAVLEGRLYTEPVGVLHGVTRSLVLEVARDLMPLADRALRKGELRAAAEAFITSTSRGILPVVKLDAVAIGAGRPGPMTIALGRAFDARLGQEAEPIGR